jgi:hypothetical protein
MCVNLEREFNAKAQRRKDKINSDLMGSQETIPATDFILDHFSYPASSRLCVFAIFLLLFIRWMIRLVPVRIGRFWRCWDSNCREKTGTAGQIETPAEAKCDEFAESRLSRRTLQRIETRIRSGA